MTQTSRRLTVALLLIGCVLAAGGQHDYVVLCVSSDGRPALEFVSGPRSAQSAGCPHGTDFRCSATVAACDGHSAGCVDIPLSVISIAVPVNAHRAPQLQFQPARGLVLVDASLPHSAPGTLTALPPLAPTRSGPLLALRTVVLRT